MSCNKPLRTAQRIRAKISILYPEDCIEYAVWKTRDIGFISTDLLNEMILVRFTKLLFKNVKTLVFNLKDRFRSLINKVQFEEEMLHDMLKMVNTIVNCEFLLVREMRMFAFSQNTRLRTTRQFVDSLGWPLLNRIVNLDLFKRALEYNICKTKTDKEFSFDSHYETHIKSAGLFSLVPLEVSAIIVSFMDEDQIEHIRYASKGICSLLNHSEIVSYKKFSYGKSCNPYELSRWNVTLSLDPVSRLQCAFSEIVKRGFTIQVCKRKKPIKKDILFVLEKLPKPKYMFNLFKIATFEPSGEPIISIIEDFGLQVLDNEIVSL